MCLSLGIPTVLNTIRFSVNFTLMQCNLSRAAELKSLKGRKYLDAWCVYFWATTPVIISILTFTTYALLGNKLTAAKVEVFLSDLNHCCKSCAIICQCFSKAIHIKAVNSLTFTWMILRLACETLVVHNSIDVTYNLIE